MEVYKINSDGKIQEWNEDFKEIEPEHRHLSHLYGLYPGNLISPDKTPELAKACKKSLDARGMGGTGWCLAWKMNLYARLQDGKKALELLNRQLEPVSAENVSYLDNGGTYPNLFDAHPPFQIDGNLGVVSGIIEMLVQSNGHEVILLPALPKQWKSGSLKGVRIKGNKICNIRWKNWEVNEYEEIEG